MIPSWASLNESERERVLVARAFLTNRLSERDTLYWAVRLEPDKHAERFTVDDLLNGRPVPAVKEPYATAWRLLEESWAYGGTDRRPSLMVQDIRRRLRAGERSGALVSEIANLVAPRLEVKPLEDRPWVPAKRPRHARRFNDLLVASLTSVSIHRDFGSRGMEIGLVETHDMAFLTALASALMAAVDRGIHIASRIYGEDDSSWGHPGKPARVYFVHVGDGTDGRAGPGSGGNEPDAFNRGVAPSVKFLHAVVLRIAEIDREAAMPFLWRWRFSGCSIYRRLWAAGARDPRLASGEDVGDFFAGLNDNQFWEPDSFPEIAELRAVRFGDLDQDAQASIVRRLRSGPPRKYWRRDAGAEKVKQARRYLAARELKRIDVAGGVLPGQIKSWLFEAVAEFPDLAEMSIEVGFSDIPVRRGPLASPKASVQLDNLEGDVRLRALENALSAGRYSWESSAGERAASWLQRPEHTVLVLSDFESRPGLADGFPRVWDCLGWFHSPPSLHSEGGPPRDAQLEAKWVLRLMSELSDATLEAAIGGISHWLHAWCRHAVRCEAGAGVWLRAWPLAVEETNAAEETRNEDDSALSSRHAGSEEQLADVDTLNAPAGELVRAFLRAFLSVEEIRYVFADGNIGKRMLDCVIESPGHSGLIARCLLMERFSCLLQANREWTIRNLVGPLSADDSESILLWRAVASNPIDTYGLIVIGDDLLKAVLDSRLGEQARELLVRSVIFEALNAFRDKRAAAVPAYRLSQMLRFADDEIRTCTARAIRIFQEEAPEVAESPRSAGELLRSTIRLFLWEIWPQERSLATPGVSRELSSLPAVSGEAFDETVDEIERFLTPFDCWSMFDYGFYDNGGAERKMTPQLSTAIDDEPKAHGLLRLLDLTIGDTQSAVVPHDLSIALERIETVAPKLATDPAFRRLSAAARR